MVHYGNVQKKVNDKYDMWHKEVLTKFGGMLGQSMQEFHATVTKASRALMWAWYFAVRCTVDKAVDDYTPL